MKISTIIMESELPKGEKLLSYVYVYTHNWG
jgi:hypothetical protein